MISGVPYGDCSGHIKGPDYDSCRGAAKLHLQAGDRVTFIENKDGDFVLKAKNGSLADVKGMWKWSGKPVSIQEMNETIRKGWAGQLKFEN